jgi:hypothetical protein
MTETTAHGCPTSSNSTPYATTTTFSSLSAGVHTIQLLAYDDQNKATIATATITVGNACNCITIPAGVPIKAISLNEIKYENLFYLSPPIDSVFRKEPEPLSVYSVYGNTRNSR